MKTITEQARDALRELTAGRTVSAVARELGLRQQTLWRFLSKTETTLAMKNMEKIMHLLKK